jgi:hypothetical protein
MEKSNFSELREGYIQLNQQRNRTNADTTLPIVEGAIIHINGFDRFNEGTRMEYFGWTNEEGVALSTNHTGRRGNGLNLAGNTDQERNLALLTEVEALEEGQSIAVRVASILNRRRMYDGVETLVSYYTFERV